MSKKFRELKRTTNRYVFNRLYKEWLERQGKIRCSLCGYNRGENNTRKVYGTSNFRGIVNSGKPPQERYPNWKLVAKNRKQWMKKPLKKEIHKNWGGKWSRYGYSEWYSYTF